GAVRTAERSARGGPDAGDRRQSRSGVGAAPRHISGGGGGGGGGARGRNSADLARRSAVAACRPAGLAATEGEVGSGLDAGVLRAELRPEESGGARPAEPEGSGDGERRGSTARLHRPGGASRERRGAGGGSQDRAHSGSAAGDGGQGRS